METYNYIFLKLLHIKISSIERIKEILIEHEFLTQLILKS